MWRVICFLCLCGGVAMASDAGASDWTGVYDSTLGLMTLEQHGPRILGAYACCDGVIEGTLVGNRLVFRWRDLLNGKGEGHFDLSRDGRTVTGSRKNTDKPSAEVPWSAVRTGEPSTPPGPFSHWRYEEVAEPLPGDTTGIQFSATGTADLYFEGPSVAGRISARVTMSGSEDPPTEAFAELHGTVAKGHWQWDVVNRNDGSKSVTILSGSGERFTGESIGEDGSKSHVTLTRLADGRTQSLIDQAWARHRRLWAVAQAAAKNPLLSPTQNDPRFAAMDLLHAGKTGEAAQAFADLAEAYRAAGDTHKRIAAMTSEALALNQLGHYEKARQIEVEILSLPDVNDSERQDAAIDLRIMQAMIGGNLPAAVGTVSSMAPDPPLADDNPIALKQKGDAARDARHFDEAIGFYQQAIAGDEAEKKTFSQPQIKDADIADVLARIARTEMLRGNWAAAERWQRQTIDKWKSFQSGGTNVATATNTLALILFHQDRKAEAIAAEGDAIIAAEAYQEAGCWRYYGQRADLEAINGNTVAALSDFKRAIGLIEDIRSNLVTDETKIGFFAKAAQIYDDYVDTLMTRANDPSTAFTVSERARSRSLLDAIDPKVKALPADYVFTGETGSNGVAATLDAGQASQRAKKEHAAYLVYFGTAAATYAWYFAPDGKMTSARLQKNIRQIEADLIAYRKAVNFSKPEAESLRSGLNAVLTGPLARALAALPAGTHLTVVPHKSLTAMPFAVLGETEGAWGQKWTLSTLPSLSIAANLAPKPTTARPRLLAVGAPDLPPGGRALIRSEPEVRQAATQFPQASILVHAKATKANVLADLPQANVVLFSTHTDDKRHTEGQQQSELVLLLSNGETLGREDLKRGTMPRAKLVVLSACKSAIGPTYGGDELMNLSRAFLVAGAEQVLVTLWDVRDGAAAAVVPRFLTKVRQGMPTAEALQKTILEYRQTAGVDGYPKAVDWAPWALIGRP